MLKIAYKIITGLTIALGILHISFTAWNYSEFNLDAMWFFGTGIAIILAGFMNLVLIRIGAKDKLILVLCQGTNIFFTALFGFALLVLLQPQVFLGLFLFLGATIMAAKASQDSTNSHNN